MIDVSCHTIESKILSPRGMASAADRIYQCGLDNELNRLREGKSFVPRIRSQARLGEGRSGQVNFPFLGGFAIKREKNWRFAFIFLNRVAIDDICRGK